MSRQLFRCCDCDQCMFRGYGERYCKTCGRIICSMCRASDLVLVRENKKRYRCEDCRADALRKQDYKAVVTHLLKNHPEFKSPEDVRDMLRKTGEMPAYVCTKDIEANAESSEDSSSSGSEDEGDDDDKDFTYEVSEQDEEDEEEEEDEAAASDAEAKTNGKADTRQPAKKRPANHARCMRADEKRTRVA